MQAQCPPYLRLTVLSCPSFSSGLAPLFSSKEAPHVRHSDSASSRRDSN